MLPRSKWRLFVLVLEDEFTAKFKRPWIECAGDLTKSTLGSAIRIKSLETVADIVELGVIESVERLEAKLKVSSFLDCKGFIN